MSVSKENTIKWVIAIALIGLALGGLFLFERKEAPVQVEGR